jgi:coenzyme F420-0:L-glutamate ligase / coenzyme F420-1:gamma-L-glutamate ligase
MSGNRPRLSRAVQRRLRQARVARLATLDREGRPHLVPVCFAYDGKFIYSAIDRKPKRAPPARLARVQNIRATPRVALLIDEYAEDWTRLWYVLVRGKAKLISGSAREERARALRKLKAKYPQYARGMLSDDAPIIRVSAERVVSWGRM